MYICTLNVIVTLCYTLNDNDQL